MCYVNAYVPFNLWNKLKECKKMQTISTYQITMWTLFLHLSWSSCCAVIQDVPSEDKTKCNRNVKDGTGNSFLWSMKRDPPSYLFGTIHVPYTRVWDYIPDNAKVAFKQSENVYFELNLTDPYTMRSLANCQLLPQGENLSNVLPVDLYTRLKDHLQYIRTKMSKWVMPDQKGKELYADYLFDIIVGNWEHKRPIWVMLLVNSLTESDIKSRDIPVLDLYLAQEAERLRKFMGAVEEVEEQCFPLNDLNYSQVLFALNQTLWQHESYRLQDSAIPYTTDDLIQRYNCGDLNVIIFNKDSAVQVPNLHNSSQASSDLHTAQLIDDYFRTELINKRNERMANRVAKLLNDHPGESFFFAFGAGHFLGNNTVIHRLQQMGFDVQHTPANEEIPKLHLNRRHRNKMRNKHQEDFGDIWDQMNTKSRDWLEKTRAEQRKRYNSNKPFNELWVRMDTPSPGLMQQIAAEANLYDDNVRESSISNDGRYLHNDGIFNSMSLFVCTLLFIPYIYNFISHKSSIKIQ